MKFSKQKDIFKPNTIISIFPSHCLYIIVYDFTVRGVVVLNTYVSHACENNA